MFFSFAFSAPTYIAMVQLQAAKWVKNMEKDNKLVVIKYSDPNYIGLIQNAVSVFFCISVADHNYTGLIILLATKKISLVNANVFVACCHQVQFGLPCLLQNVDENLDPGLGPILLKQVIIIIMIMKSDFMT